MQTIGAAAGTFLLIAVLARELHVPAYPLYSVAARNSRGHLVALFSGVAGCLWGRVISHGTSTRITTNKTIRVIAFAISLFFASVAPGSGIGYLAGLANQLGAPGYLADAAVVGCLAGPLVIPLGYALIRPVRPSGGIAALIILAVLLVGVLTRRFLVRWRLYWRPLPPSYQLWVRGCPKPRTWADNGRRMMRTNAAQEASGNMWLDPATPHPQRKHSCTPQIPQTSEPMKCAPDCPGSSPSS